MTGTDEEVIGKLEAQRLLEAARDVRLRAYAPYSKYLVGAAALCKDGQIYGGCNVENVSYPLCMCAERVAVASAIAAGAGAPLAIAVVTENGGSPCGACRQVLVEMNPEMTVLIGSTAVAGAADKDAYRVTTAAGLMPDAFALPPEA